MKVAFIFPGQASQYVGMGKDLYENSQIAREIFDATSRNCLRVNFPFIAKYVLLFFK